MHNRCLPPCSDSRSGFRVLVCRGGCPAPPLLSVLGIVTSPCFSLVSVEGINLAGFYVEGIGSEPTIHLILLSSPFPSLVSSWTQCSLTLKQWTT